jgi:hypothetical protein
MSTTEINKRFAEMNGHYCIPIYLMNTTTGKLALKAIEWMEARP